MKIIVNALSARSGGISTYTRNLARSFVERKVDATFAISDELDFEFDIKTIVLNAHKMRPLQRFLWEQTIWRSIVKRNKFDILFSSANFGLIVPPIHQVLLLREGGLFDPFYLTNIGSYTTVRGLLARIARRRLVLASTNSADLILTPSKTLRNQLYAWDDNLKNRIEVNYYGTDLDLFNFKLQGNVKKKRETLKLLFVSAYYPHKQPGLIAEAVKQLNLKGIPTHLTLTMDLEKLKQTKGSDKDVFLLNKSLKRGHLSMIGDINYEALPKIYKDHDLFIFPSLSETFGHPLAEAMSIGIPVIAADTPIHREICGKAALYFSPLNPSSLTQQIMRINENEDLRTGLIKAGLQNSATNYIWEHHVDRLISSFKKLL